MSYPGFSRGEVIFGLGLFCVGALVMTAAGERVTRAASDADAASDLRGLAAAGLLYVTEQNGLLPPYNPKDVISGQVGSWHWSTSKVATLRPYIADDSFLFNVGEDPVIANSASRNDSPSYGMNIRLNRVRALEMSNIQNPGKKVWFAEAGHLANGERKKGGLDSFVVNPDKPANEAGVFPRRDGVGAFVVYFDGRVELIDNVYNSEVASPMLTKDPQAALRAHWNL